MNTYVYIVTDVEGERVEVYTYEDDAAARCEELNARMGEGWASYECHEVLGEGERPSMPHHGF